MANSQRVRKKFSPEERADYQRKLALVAQDEAEIKAIGREVRRQHEESVAQVIALLRAAREECGLSLSDIQDRTGMDRSSLSRLLNDTTGNPSLMTLNRVAKACGKRLVVSLVDNR